MLSLRFDPLKVILRITLIAYAILSQNMSGDI